MRLGVWDIKEELGCFDPRDYEGFLYYMWFPDIDYHYIGIKKFWTQEGALSPWLYYTSSNKDVQRLIAEGYQHKQKIIKLFSCWSFWGQDTNRTRTANKTEARLISLLSHKHGDKLLNVSKYPFDSEYKMRKREIKDSDITKYTDNDYQALSVYKQVQDCSDLSGLRKLLTKTKVILSKPLSVERIELTTKTMDIIARKLDKKRNDLV